MASHQHPWILLDTAHPSPPPPLLYLEHFLTTLKRAEAVKALQLAARHRSGDRTLARAGPLSHEGPHRSDPHGHLNSELVRAPADRALAGERRRSTPGSNASPIRTAPSRPAASSRRPRGRRMRHEPRPGGDCRTSRTQAPTASSTWPPSPVSRMQQYPSTPATPIVRQPSAPSQRSRASHQAASRATVPGRPPCSRRYSSCRRESISISLHGTVLAPGQGDLVHRQRPVPGALIHGGHVRVQQAQREARCTTVSEAFLEQLRGQTPPAVCAPHGDVADAGAGMRCSITPEEDGPREHVQVRNDRAAFLQHCAERISGWSVLPPALEVGSIFRLGLGAEHSQPPHLVRRSATVPSHPRASARRALSE